MGDNYSAENVWFQRLASRAEGQREKAYGRVMSRLQSGHIDLRDAVLALRRAYHKAQAAMNAEVARRAGVGQ